MSFAQVPGHEAAKEIMKKAIRNERISHAYLLAGKDGIGKKALAEQFARAIFCPKKETDSCDSCLVCRKIEHGNHPDLKLIRGETIKIDQIRDLQKEIAYKPYESNRKVYIIENADRMTPQAANSLLKTLEEPPSYAIIILLAAEVSRLLPTIVSRCQRINLAVVPREEIKRYLLDNKIEPEKAELFSRLAAGSPGRALELVEDEDFLKKRSYLLEFLQKIQRLNTVDIFASSEKMEEFMNGDFPVFDLLSTWYRDIMLYRNNSENLIINHDYLEIIKEQARLYTQRELQGIIKLLAEYEEYIERNIRMDLVFEVMLLKIRGKRV
ncbi:MAG: DNA polymerase III subunit delta' [Halanaerobiales bacterium]